MLDEGGRGDGQLYSVADSKTDLTYQYSYDSQGRLMSSSVTDVSDPNNPVKVITTRQTYDANNQLSAQYWQLGSTQYSETYTYSKTTGLLATHKPAVGNTLSYGYDVLQRLTSVTGGIYGKTYTYRNASGNNTTTQVSQLKYSLPTEILYGYTYDNLGNIATYTEGGTTYTYTYDAQNQLTKQTGGGKTYTYTYDAAGNIQTASNGTTSHTYAYENTTWRDLLTKFDGQSITYDNAGNPTSYYNSARWTMTWAEGRRLTAASKSGTSLSFTYDSDGLRLSKNVNGTVHNYSYAGNKLMRETWGSNTLDFFYDSTGIPYALKYNGTLYYYITNLQGDVLKIVNTSGTPVVSYSYDPYGKPTVTSDTSGVSLGTINPIRYRGYVYDAETGLYYLQARYYDPITGRFINADGYASTGQGILGHNMFAYCCNNPVNMIDSSGEIAISALILIISAVIGAASAGYTAYTTYQAGWDVEDILWYTFGAGLSGFLTVYSLGMSAYQLYLNYCMLNGITPISDISLSSNNVPATSSQDSYSATHTSGTTRPDKLNNPPANGSYVQYDSKGKIYSYTQFDEQGRQSLRIDFQGRPHAETLPHIHLYKYMEKGGRKEYTFDLVWNLLDD